MKKLTLILLTLIIVVAVNAQKKWPDPVNGVITLQPGVIYEGKTFNKLKNTLIIGNGAFILGFQDYDGKMPILYEPDVITYNGELLYWSQGEGGESYIYRDGEYKWYLLKVKNTGQNGNGLTVNDPATVTDNTYAYTPALFGLLNRNLHVTDHSGIQFSSTGEGLEFNDCENIIIQDLIICGFNRRGIKTKGGNSIIIRNVEIWGVGWDGIGTEGTTNVHVFNSNIHDVLGNGINFSGNNYGKVHNTTFKRIGLQPGKGEFNGETNYIPACAIRNDQGNNCEFTFNKIDSTQYNGIGSWSCDGTVISDNIISNTNLLLDDGGAIYTWARSSQGSYVTNTIIRNNHITNAIGSTYLIDGNDLYLDASGIYMDDGNRGALIENNIVRNATRALFVHNSDKINIRNNQFFNCTAGILYRNNHSSHDIVGSNFEGNYVEANDYLIYTWSQSESNKIWENNKWGNNIYSKDRPFRVSSSTNDNKRTLAQWQSMYGNDINSKVEVITDETPVSIPIPQPEPEPNPDQNCDTVFVEKIIHDTIYVDNDSQEINCPVIDIVQNYYVVYLDGFEYSYHNNLSNCIQEMINLKMSNPDFTVTYETRGSIK